MRYLRPMLALFSILLIALPASGARRATFYTTWDDHFLYVAFEVQDPDVRSDNTKHMSEPWKDDAVEVYVQRDGARTETWTPQTCAMSVSAGNGSSWFVGEDGKPTPKKIFSFKYSAKVQGTLNRSDDRDLGYTVEMALPWSEMGGPPNPDDIMGFNTICRLRGENEGFISFSPNVKTEDDIPLPAKWGRIKFVTRPTIVALEDGAVVCRKVLTRAPWISGNLERGEWNRDINFSMVLPEPSPVAARPEKFMVEKVALARYYCDFPNGSLVHRPMQGEGPWFSGTRVGWHREQLAGAVAAGIDVVLPVCPGAAPASMAQALKELRALGGNYPLVGMHLAKAASPDAVYGLIRDFFLSVPEEFRAAIQTPAERGGGAKYIVHVASGLTLDQGVIDLCNERFASDFGGRGLLWIGGSDLKGLTLDGFTGDPGQSGPRFDDSGWINAGALSPCSDSLERAGGEVFRRNWDAASNSRPDWILLDSWNGFHKGNGIAPTMEFGEWYIDQTKLGLMRFNGGRQFDAKFLSHDVPSVILPGALYQVSVTMKNAGTKAWYSGTGVYMAGRWFKDGVLVGDTGLRLPIQVNIPPGQVSRKMIGIHAVGHDGRPLPEGDYELRIELARKGDEWFANGGDTPLRIPVKIGAPPPGFTFISSTVPTMIKAGAGYNVRVTLRNDGPKTWKAGTATISYAWHGNSSVPVPLPADVQPGHIVELGLPVTGEDSASVNAGIQGITWSVFDGESDLAPAAPGVAFEPVMAVESDYGPRFVFSDTPGTPAAGKKVQVTVGLVNTSAETWKKDNLGVGYRWYHIDGTEATGLSGRTGLPTDVRSGARVDVKVSVLPPAHDGQYYLLWDLVKGDEWVSTGESTRGDGTLLIPVNVTGGRLVALDLAFDSDVISLELNIRDGDADGTGITLPGESMPPLVTATPRGEKLWPSDGLKNISFKYPGKSDGAKNALTCKGQTIPIKKGKYSAVHVLAFSTQDTSAEFKLKYKNREQPVAAGMTAWTAPPGDGEYPALICTRVHTPDGVKVGETRYLKHYVLHADGSSELTGLTLPNNPSIKIMAVTLEKPE